MQLQKVIVINYCIKRLSCYQCRFIQFQLLECEDVYYIEVFIFVFIENLKE